MSAEQKSEQLWEVRGKHRGGWMALDPAPAQAGGQRAGTVHHIGWGTTDAEHREPAPQARLE
jgi:glyoxalase family protein